MRERYKNALMWALYAALVLFVLVVQTVSFGRPRFFGVKLCFVPVLVACVSMHVGSEAGGVFGMACGLLWALSGADGGALHIVLLAGCGAVCGYLCDRYLVRNLVSALLMSLLCLRRFPMCWSLQTWALPSAWRQTSARLTFPRSAKRQLR